MENADTSELSKYGQEHILQFVDEISDQDKKELMDQIADINFGQISELTDKYLFKNEKLEIPAKLEPAPFFPLEPESEEQKDLYAKASQKGKELLTNGKVAALTVAGGQGTRLGYDGPKGTYPISPVRHKSLFRYFAESILRINEKYECSLKWYIMTSVINDESTKKFFGENSYFGMEKDSVRFFKQGTMPAVDYNGRLLMASKNSLALSPDGHGGTLLALKKSGCLDKMKEEGTEYISYFQVDNPLVSVADPLFIGLHAMENSEMSSRMLSKTGPYEKLGNFCIGADGKLRIIEYSDMPSELAESIDGKGKLRFIAGSPAIHIISTSFVEKLTAGNKLSLPWHRADKKIPHINDKGESINPDSPNGVKFESFIFDALPLAEKSIILEARREDEFAPTKNKSGVDSAESAREMLIDRDCRRLEKAGIEIPRQDSGKADCILEISPRSVVDDEDAIKHFANSNIQIKNKEEIYLQ